MTLDQFIAKWKGNKADFDGAYQGQCVDLFRFYNKEVLNIAQPAGVAGAADFWLNYQSDPILKANFEKILNTPEFVPKKGDVVIWNKKAGGGFGHIAIFVEGGVTSFTSFDQNWRAINVCELTTHDYKNVYGVLRPVPVIQEDMSEELKACLAQHKDLIDQLEAQKKLTTTAQTALGDERIRHQETKTELDLVKKELDDEEDEHTKDLERIAVLLDVSPEMSAIIPAVETCITYEDKANRADKALQEAKDEYDANLKQAAKTVDDLKKQVIALEQKIVQLQNEKPDSGTVVPSKSIWDLIVEFFTRKQV